MSNVPGEVSARGGSGWKVLGFLALAALAVYVFYPHDHRIRNREADFSVRVSSTWEAGPRAKFYWTFTRQAGVLPQAEIRVGFARDPDARAEPDMRVINEAFAKLRSQEAFFVLQESEPVDLAGLKAYRLTYSYKKRMGGLPVENHTVHEVLIWRQAKGVYGITMETRLDSWEIYKPDYDQVVASFRVPAE